METLVSKRSGFLGTGLKSKLNYKRIMEYQQIQLWMACTFVQNIFVKCHVCKNWNSEILSNFQKNSKVNENTITKNCVVDLQFSCCNNMTDNYYFLLRNTFSKMPAAIFFPFAHVLFWSAVVCAAMTELVSSATCRTIVITAAHVLFWSAVVCAVMTELVSSALGPLLSQLRICCFDQLLCVQSWRSWSSVL